MKTSDLPQVISVLRKNSRASITELAKSTHMPVSTVFERFKRIDRALVKKYCCFMDFTVMGYPNKAGFLIKIEKPEYETVKKYIYSQYNVNTLRRVSNDYDFYIECFFKAIYDSEDFIERLKENFNIIKYHMFYILEDIKFEEFVPQPKN